MSAPDARLSTVFNRFGLGARPGDFARVDDPRDYLIAELNAPDSALIADPALPRGPEAIQAVYADQDRKRIEREKAALDALASVNMPDPAAAARDFPVAQPGPAMTGSAAPAMMMTTSAGEAMGKPTPPPEQVFFRAEALARVRKGLEAPVGFVERLVAFWSNHFCVSVAKSNIGRACAGAFEREAIRPYVTGRFADMLRAVEQHPTMLNFLDNAQSIGPNSRAGRNSERGLNENLAREILELHTLGVGAGYTQTDVTELARIITGWTFAGREGKLGEPGSFIFNANAHEPGAATLLGRIYAQDGLAQGEAALADIARNPAVATHIARKFARHFVADDPPKDLVQRLTRTFNDSEGDLGALARALVEDDAAWAAPPAKMRNPWELTMATMRAFGRPADDAGPVLNALNLLGMPLWQPGGPNGFSDDVAAWSSPEGMKTRLELAGVFSRQIKDAPPPVLLLDEVLGPGVSSPTRDAVSRAESREQAFALLILSPEFQRR